MCTRHPRSSQPCWMTWQWMRHCRRTTSFCAVERFVAYVTHGTSSVHYQCENPLTCWQVWLGYVGTFVRHLLFLTYYPSSINLVHPNGAQTITPQSQSILHGDVGGKTASSTGTNTPNGSKSDGNIFFECMVCKRQVSTGLNELYMLN